jgi:radical S-adenosyl methionine domain-containing protein 2
VKLSQELGHVAAGASNANSATETATIPPSVNYHLLIPCNMRCRGCFATFHDVRSGVPAGMLPKDQSLELVNALAMSFEKVTFAGGEPTLCPWLPELIAAAKSRGRTTMLVTNGTRLTDSFLDAVAGALDWVTLSIDSVDPEVHVALGRAVSGRALSAQRYVEIAAAAKRRGLGLKVNTVVSALNADQDFTHFLRAIGPSRWKALQVLPVDGQNDGSVEGLLIERERFLAFCARHDHLTHDGIEVVPEDNDAMTGSYAMVDPAGRFFDNSAGRHRYSDPILGVGLKAAWGQVTFHEDRFYDRGGVYNWTKG